MITEYVVLWETATDLRGKTIDEALEKLQKQVASAIAKGWQPHGSMSTACDQGLTRFFQPVVATRQ